MKHAIVLMSGGMDSAACVHLLKRQGFGVRGIFVDYGQAAAEHERVAVRAQEAFFDITVEEVAVSHLGQFGAGEIVGRNLLLVSLALALSRSGDNIICIGVHAGTDYWDCSSEFVTLADDVVQKSSVAKVSLFAPFISWNKRDLIDYFVASSIPLEVTYSCEAGVVRGCGRCRSCTDRSGIA